MGLVRELTEADFDPLIGAQLCVFYALFHKKAPRQRRGAFLAERVGEIRFAGEIDCGGEIRLDAGWVDFISPNAQAFDFTKGASL